MKRLVLMFGVLSMVTYVACKQGDGGRCQVNEDCDSDICNTSKGTCAPKGGAVTDIDAPPPPIDAPDAPPDSPSDAAADAP